MELAIDAQEKINDAILILSDLMNSGILGDEGRTKTEAIIFDLEEAEVDCSFLAGIPEGE